MTTSHVMQAVDNKPQNPPYVDDHRHKCFWESTFDKSIDLSLFLPLLISEVNKKRNNSDHLKNYVIDFDIPKQNDPDKPNTTRIKIENATFETCDFKGNNKGQKITFRKCIFKKVYFGYSVLHDVTFEDCDFRESSFSLAKFNECTFNEGCKFKKISFSGGKTSFNNSILRSGSLLFNSYEYATNKYCEEHGLHKEDQVYRMSLSQVKLARNILNSVSIIGDDDIYYDATKTLFKLRLKERESKIKLSASKYLTDAKKSKSCKSLLFYCYKKIRSFFFPLEKGMLNSFGMINGWGSNLLRCMFFGGFIFLIFSITYFIQSYSSLNGTGLLVDTIYKSMIKSLDITFLAGYTKYSVASDSSGNQLLLLSNMILGLFWYGVSLPTLINKISVARV
ncbi:pentapeptide repeat-containing protein [Citrobacter portucalensis]|uniref:pentapeptide repeat-containing protein n=1 Tax=Citrobacter portucalensis TaxID=1639133 RepID=UPI00207D1814|nr:pentapeptide repeat-containing protein [Citrobacter portucalensis]MCO4137005.1 pentapeptide repeat-containing protein [Citrobacter portucalensis]MCO4154572.1 pentapeptide repeat-containing protein [Citrobacter portucalensis]